MTRAHLLVSILLLTSCGATPGIIGATASGSSEGGAGSGDSTTTTTDSGASVTGPIEPQDSTTESEEPKLDAYQPQPCDGLCGIEWRCGGPVGMGRSVTTLPDGTPVLVAEVGTPSRFRFTFSGYPEGSTEPSDPPTSVSSADFAFDGDLRAALLVAQPEGYLLQQRSSPEYATTWERALLPTASSTLTVTDIAASHDGTVYVAGFALDESIGAASTELVVQTYAVDGSEVGMWSESGSLGVVPKFLYDHVDQSIVVWAEVTLADETDHHYWVRRLDEDGAVDDAVDLAFALPIIDRPSRRSDAWISVSSAGNGLALRMLDEAFASTDLVYDLPQAPEAISPVGVLALDDASIVLVQPQPLLLRLQIYDSAGVRRLDDEPVEDLYEDGSGAVSAISLATHHTGRMALVIGYDTADEEMTYCDLDFSGR